MDFWIKALIFLVGLIIGFIGGVVSKFEVKIEESSSETVKPKEVKGKTQFFEPFTPQERFNKADKIDDFLEKL